MGKILRNNGALLTLDDVRAAIAFNQPKLYASATGETIAVEGGFLVHERGIVAAPEGPIAEFEIRVELTDRFPQREPKVFEIGGRIPREDKRHINGGGDCCVTVWEHWLATASDHSIASYIDGPLHEYFLGQFYFEKTGRWPFGERPHGYAGLQEAFADALGVPNKKESLLYHLRLLSQDWPKGHWLCPCGSGALLRHCHRNDMMDMHQKIPPPAARRMLKRMKADGR